ncbi:hypothetical protein PFLG_02240 [Plasmodium falciparum RAJ116]|uniref:Uncharacterized protein n=1 Tax=Plasmodium falciparum RAJ116 TaxID=580058 RepID=A0A0L0CXG9_PLAFA|nr:hypothetical protein PFLG_02240 [Plasmodium falciparum RAJ116]
MFFLYNKLTGSSRKFDDILKEKNADVEKKDVTLNLDEKKNVEEYKKNKDVFKNEEDNFFFVFDDKEINKLNKIKEEQCNMKENEFINEKGYILNDENVSTINNITSLNNDILHSSDKNVCTSYNIYPSNGNNNNNNNNNVIHSNNSNIFVNDSHMEHFDDITDEFFKIDQTNFSFFQFNTSFENKKNVNEEELMKHTDNINICDKIIDKKKNCNTLSDLIHDDNLFNDNLNIYEDNNNKDDVISTDLFMLKNNYNKNFEKNEIDVVVDTSTTFENINNDNNEKNLYNLNNQMSDKELLNNNKDDTFYINNKFLISENNILLEDKDISFIDRKIESNKCEDYCVNNNNNNNERNNLSDILENAYSKDCESRTINEDRIYNNFEDMDKISHDAFDFIIPSSFNKEEDNGNEKYQNVFDSNKDNLENINVEDPPFSNFSEEKQNFFQNCDMSENIWLNKKFDEHNVFEKNEIYEPKNVYENENYDQKDVDESSKFFENNVFFWDDKNKNVDEIIDSGVEGNCDVEEKLDKEEEKTYFVETGINYGDELPRRNFEEIDENYKEVVEEKFDEKMGENIFEEVEEKFDEKMGENFFEEVEENFGEKVGKNIFEEVEENFDEKVGENIFEEVEEKFDEKMGEFFFDEVEEKFDEKMGENFFEEIPKKDDVEIEETYSEKMWEIHDEKIKDKYDEPYEKIHDEKKEVEEFFLIADKKKEENEDSNVEILNIDKNNFYFENKETF